MDNEIAVYYTIITATIVCISSPEIDIVLCICDVHTLARTRRFQSTLEPIKDHENRAPDSGHRLDHALCMAPIVLDRFLLILIIAYTIFIKS